MGDGFVARCPHPPGYEGEPCDDDDECTVDICDAGIGCQNLEKNCDDFDPCTEDWCDSDTGNCGHGPRDPEPFTTGCQACTVDLGVPAALALNDDDDNGIADYLDAGPLPQEDDLVPVSIDVSGCPSCASNVEWHICERGGNRQYTLFLEDDKTEPVHHGNEWPWPVPSTAYFEGIQSLPCPNDGRTRRQS